MMETRNRLPTPLYYRFRKSLRLYASIFLVLWSCIFLRAHENGIKHREYKIRAAYLYHFLLLTELPLEADGQSKDTITIAILGEPAFDSEIFLPIAGKKIDNKKVVVKHCHKLEEIEEFESCFLLYVGRSQAEHLPKIFDAVGHYPVLLVSDIPGFLHQGGMIRFISIENTIRFMINKKAVDKSGIRISSQVLRVAIDALE